MAGKLRSLTQSLIPRQSSSDGIEPGASKKEKKGHRRDSSRTLEPQPSVKELTGRSTPNAVLTSLEKEIFSSNFEAEKYARDLFTNKEIDSVKDHLRALEDEKIKTSEKLKKKVHQNYSQFIFTSKEISNMEGDLMHLRNLLNSFNESISDIQNRPSFDRRDLVIEAGPLNLSASNKETFSKTIAEDVQLLLDIPNQLDFLLAERKFDICVQLVEQANCIIKEKPILALEYIRNRIESRSLRLSSILLGDLQNPNLNNSENKRTVEYLVRLGLGSHARDTFLETRTRFIQQNIKKVKFVGDNSQYIGELSRFIFSSISSTFDDFSYCFEDPALMSGFVVWAVKELESFMVLMRRQIFNSDDFELISRAIEVSKTHCKILESRGLSLDFILERLVGTELSESMKKYGAGIESAMMTSIMDDDWVMRAQYDINLSPTALADDKAGGEGKRSLQLSESGRMVFVKLQTFVNNSIKAMSLKLLPIVVSVVSTVSDKYFAELSKKISSTDLAEKQLVCILANANNIAEDLVPNLKDQIEDHMKMQIKEFESLVKGLKEKNIKMQETFAKQRATFIVSEKLDWENTDYTFDKTNSEISSKFIKLMEWLTFLSQSLKTALGSSSISVISLVAQNICSRIHRAKIAEWKFGSGGVNQIILDMKFVQEVLSRYLNDRSKKHLNEIITTATTTYKASGNDATKIKADDWFQKHAKKQIQASNLKDDLLKSQE